MISPPLDDASGVAIGENSFIETTTASPSLTNEPLTSEASAGRGRKARSLVTRSSHGAWRPLVDRPDPVGQLELQAAQRVAELVPLRHGRMLTSPLAFYRGAALLMADDLGREPHSDLTVQLCGDAHLSNFGLFASPDRRIVFGVNDFDETLPGPFEWDLKRLVASFTIAARSREFTSAECERISNRVTRAYRTAMWEFAAMRPMDVWYSRLDADQIAARFGGEADASMRKSFSRTVTKAEGRTSLRAFDRLTSVVDGRRQFVTDHPVVVPLEQLVAADRLGDVESAAAEILESYGSSMQSDRRYLLSQYEYVHAARKVVGVGSVGTRAWLLLLVARTTGDPLILQFKEAQASVLEEFLGSSTYATHGERVVAGQRLMQAATDILLGWHSGVGFDDVRRDFFVRQLWDGKGSAAVETMQHNAMAIYAEMCGWTLARAHARSGDPIAIANYLGKSDRMDVALTAFGAAYADQNDRDFAAARAAVATGRLEAVAV